MVSERARGIAAGADAYITKPFVNKELIEQVSEIWDAAMGVKTED
jgi:DNA-binding response OmpR family regulator